MTLRCEIEEAINAIEKGRAKKAEGVKLPAHRWTQVLRILKFYRLKKDELDRDPLWDTDQSDPESPYYYIGLSKEALKLAHQAYLDRSLKK